MNFYVKYYTCIANHRITSAKSFFSIISLLIFIFFHSSAQSFESLPSQATHTDHAGDVYLVWESLVVQGYFNWAF